MTTSPAPAAERVVTVICRRCKTDLTQVKPEQRPIASHADIGLVQVGIACPKCSGFVHSFFLTDELNRQWLKLEHALANMYETPSQKAQLDYQTARVVYAREFDRAQKRWKRKLGVRA